MAALSGDHARFGQDRRVKKGDEFAAILKSGRRASTALLSVALVPARGHGRIGISASTRIGGAVQRNRARRVVREYYRHTYKNTAPYDIVVNLKPGFAEISTVEARAALDHTISRAIAAGKGPGRRPHARD